MAVGRGRQFESRPLDLAGNFYGRNSSRQVCFHVMQPRGAAFSVSVDHPQGAEYRLKAIARPSFIRVKAVIIWPLCHTHSVPDAP